MVEEGQEKGQSTSPGSPGGESALSQGERGKKAPRWTVAFLRALERTGEVRAAAEDSGVDHSTAYARRRAHAEFALEWDGALERFRAAKAEREAAELEAIRARPSPGSPAASPTSPARGRGELVGAGSQMKRAGHGRWSEAKEKLFFDELAATANVKRAAAAAGVSPNAVYARRMKNPHFKAKWAAVVETGKAAIEMKLVEAANRSFDPDELDVADAEPKVSVAEAIKLTQGAARKAQDELPDPYAEQAAAMSADEVAELRAKLVRKLRRMRDRDMPDMIAQGWSYDEVYDHMVPPGWVIAPEWRDPPEEGGA